VDVSLRPIDAYPFGWAAIKEKAAIIIITVVSHGIEGLRQLQQYFVLSVSSTRIEGEIDQSGRFWWSQIQ
jgi:hypothetical protein